MNKLTEVECLEIGGHCWSEDIWIISGLPMHHVCIHCGKKQVGIEHPRYIEWKDEVETAPKQV